MDRDIPFCYDPVYQAERREYMADMEDAKRKHCDCCGHTIFPGERSYRLLVRKMELIVCSDCMEEAAETEYDEGE